MLPATSSWMGNRTGDKIHGSNGAGMSTHLSLDHGFRELSVLVAITLLIAACAYLLGWVRLRLTSQTSIPAWRAASFFSGLFLVWVASASSLAAYDHSLLTAHMIKHLLLMTIAPALILLGEPLRVSWIAMPPFARPVFRRMLLRPSIRRLARVMTNPVLCWAVSAMTLLAWHLPALFTLGMSSESWHGTEQISFFFAGLLFWCPVIQPWPSPLAAPRWSMLLYLFLATLPCDILSGFLAFSDRVVYPMYLSAPRLFGLSVLEDQQCAAALMWTCITFVYIVPAVIICWKQLAPRTSHEDSLQRSQLSGA
jgi:putative membrane protein